MSGNPVAAPVPAPYLDALNDKQREAVEATEGPLLVLAGAGTGKTRVLTARLAHITVSGRAWPGQILAVTFTNKAAREMRDRVAALIGGAVEGLWIGTFHALAARILRRHAEAAGLRPDFTILDADDQIRLVKSLAGDAGVDLERWPARSLHAAIDRFKNRGLGPEKISAADAADIAHGKIGALYTAYQERLKTVNACDFGDLLLHCLNAFTAHADILDVYHERFRYILVDEYQDTNVAQYLWLRLLAQRRRNICCVGDDDQSIYSWRGAEVGNILRFETDFPGARIVRLEQNYRSTPEILSGASALIAKNTGRLGKTLWTDATSGSPIRVRGVWDGEAEAMAVTDEIEAFQRRGVGLGAIAVLVRASSLMRAFEERFVAVGLPYRVVGGPRFYERQEIRDAVAYFRLVHQPDDDLAFERVVNLPRRGIGAATVQTLHKFARASGISLTEAARRLIGSDELNARARNALARFLTDLDRWRSGSFADHTALARAVLDESGYTDMWRAVRTPDGPGRLENLRELVTALEEFQNLGGFLEHISLVMDRDDVAAQDTASLMTLHAAKGLEFDHVFLPGWEEDIFPNRRSVDEGGAASLEEERRLAYVGLTRARKSVAISFAASRRIFNQWIASVPSRFVGELPREHLDIMTDSGLMPDRAMRTGGELPGGDVTETAGRGPGYARLRRARRSAAAPAIEGTARRLDGPAPGFEIGVRVFHQKFGYGKVVAAEAGKLKIDFEKTGIKKVMESFVEPA